MASEVDLGREVGRSGCLETTPIDKNSLALFAQRTGIEMTYVPYRGSTQAHPDLIAGRVDVAKFSNGCARMENFLPTTQGPALSRPGTRHVAEVKDSADRTWLIRFERSTDQSYMLEFGDGYIRFYTNRAVLQTGEYDYAWNLQVEDDLLKRLEAGGKGRVVASASGAEVRRPPGPQPSPPRRRASHSAPSRRAHPGLLPMAPSPR